MTGGHLDGAAPVPPSVANYLARRGATGGWEAAGADAAGFAGAVVIPALAESRTLFATLASLGENPASLTPRYLVVVVVNNRPDASDDDKRDNAATLQRLEQEESGYPFPLAWIDAASAGRELPCRSGGVGLARKIGLDFALPRLDFQQRDPLLICLDADTLVRNDYLPAIEGHFREAAAGGAVIPFRHRQGENEAEEQAIVRYELFLRSYVLGLKLASSPYAFHTVGSAMACRASAYVKMGGMNTRAAGEDFYFLQQLHRTSGVAGLAGTMVSPSPRASHRVPFGTGRSVSRLLNRDPAAVLFYDSRCFTLLGEWLAMAITSCHLDGKDVLRQAGSVSPELGAYLEGICVAEVWDSLRINHPSPARFRKAFHDWFDGLKTMKLIHYLSDTVYPRCEPNLAVPELLSAAGAPPVAGAGEQLRLLREMQQQEDFRPGR